MKPKVDKCRPKNTELKVGFNAKVKFKRSTPSNSLAKKSKKKQERSPNKLSTLDNWLLTLYQSPPQKNEKAPTKTVPTETETIKKTTEVAVKKPTRLYLYIKLEKLDLLRLKNGINHRKNKENYSKNIQVKSTSTKQIKKKRSSEYIKLATKDYKCSKCDFIHCNLVSMRTHFDKEHSEQIYKCDLCPFQTRQYYYFNTHVRYHSRPDMECPHCKKMIKWFSYKMHIKTHERNDKTEYKCQHCEYRSYNNANVKRHTLTLHKNPHDLKTFSCDSCSYVTILEERMKQHKKRVHTKEGHWLTCPQCEYTTRSKSHMARHKNDLHKEKSVQCTECSQLFSSISNMRYHIQRMHSDQSKRKFYYCEMCPKEEQYRTTEKGNLARHILAHRTLDEIEVFACHKCPYLGKSKNALKTHLINAHLPEMHCFKCKVCGYSTSTKSRYSHHVKDVHGKPQSEKYKRQKRNKINPKSLRKNVESNNNKAENVVAGFERSEITLEDIKQEITYIPENTDIFADLHASSAEDVENLDMSVMKKQLQLTDLWPLQDNH